MLFFTLVVVQVGRRLRGDVFFCIKKQPVAVYVDFFFVILKTNYSECALLC